ncbi:UvrD/REP helicase N-terminal domain-containing protein [Filimonas lacunae]|uniref:DNA 3'-5' helicase n=1 Tax=Filimonas lacunae TaxID=477680 RepID=A0A173MHQ5_9BACT|nr:UvrD-helicase domain-containing protein [Filimonas lacunae]BAV07154.1 F-box DNA helicase 1 [Filimonas lacunae]SIS94200.1 UvrD/REP helicase N-terminal domain-containing protein [Filimonas lacunae]
MVRFTYFRAMLTQEQEAIVNSTGNIKINAVAGSGKTTTLLAYAAARPQQKILYLAFNKAVKLEAEKKFSAKRQHHVKVDTAHSLAFSRIVAGSKYTIKTEGYKIPEIVEILQLNNYTGKHTEYILATHISALIASFCNSNKLKVQEVNYEDTVTDAEALEFVNRHKEAILYQARLFLDKMNKAEIGITHDFYLKKLQLTKPQLPYDVILFDEGQDASEAMLDIFLSQKAIKVIVGDSHQQIYGWRNAVNSLEKVAYPTFHLSTSFRFNQEIAELATEVIGWKKRFQKNTTITVKGAGKPPEKVKTRAVVARTNAGLLVKAIELLIEKKEISSVYFEGRIENYTYASDGASIYDVLNLYTGEKGRIRDPLIASMANLDELEDYIDNTGDAQLRMLVEVVKEYGKKIAGYIKKLKEDHLEHNDKEKADMIFSTVHRCKGMEYDEVTLAGDFITEDKIKSILARQDDANIPKLAEEVNLLYVAVTRTRGKINIPEELLSEEDDATPVAKPKTTVQYAAKSRTYQASRNTNSGQKPWKNNEDIRLLRLFADGKPVIELAKFFGRTPVDVIRRIKELNGKN